MTTTYQHDPRLARTAEAGNRSRVSRVTMWKWVLAWIPMVLIAIANGALREGWYGPHMDELRAHQLSTLSGALLLGAYIWRVVRVWRPAHRHKPSPLASCGSASPLPLSFCSGISLRDTSGADSCTTTMSWPGVFGLSSSFGLRPPRTFSIGCRGSQEEDKS